MSVLAIISTLLSAPLLTGVVATLLSKHNSRTNTAGLLFHSVSPSPKPNMSSFSSRRFEKFLSLLDSNKTGTTTVSKCQKASDSSENAIITFDDGFLDFYTHALPLLEKRSMKSTVFPVAGHIGSTSTWDVMGRLQHLSAEMIREIAHLGHEIGSHTLSHANLPWLSDKLLKKELQDSKKILEDITGSAVKSISFPFGGWNTRVWEAARESGYTCGTVYRGHSKAPPELLPVLGVYHFDKAQDIIEKAFPQKSVSVSRTQALIMSHFSKGTPIWKFRREYDFFPSK
ncbi:MAG: polysaccharide deacetylase family protein [Chitinispirillaceae bacterium]